MQISYDSLDLKNEIIDVRSKLDYDEYHIENSINIPRFNLLKNHELYLNKSKTYYIICSRGELSLSCSKILNALGYNCYSIIGGIEGIRK